MASHSMHVSLYLAVFLSAVYGRPNSLGFPMVMPSNHSDCQRPDALMACYAPMLAFIMSPEGQQLQQLGRPGAKISDVITESVFRHACSFVEPMTSCMDDWTAKCLAVTPELRASQQLMSRANVKMLSVCNETDGYSKLITVVHCGEKIQDQVMSCAGTVITAVTESQRRRFPDATSENAMDFAKMAAVPQKIGCCFVKKFKECIAPSVQSTCTADEKTVTKALGDRILGAYECTDAIYQDC